MNMMFTLKMSVSDHLSAVSSCQNSALNPSWARTCRYNKTQGDPRRRPRGRRGGARSRCGRWGCPPFPPPPPSVTLWRRLIAKNGPVIELKIDSLKFTIRLHNVHISERAKSFHWNEFSSPGWWEEAICVPPAPARREERGEKAQTSTDCVLEKTASRC